MPKLVLIDGHAILHRAFHALPPTLTNREGTSTNAIYGFMTMLLRVLDDLKPTHLAVCFDLPQPTFRQQVYLAYQAKRPEMIANLKDQIPLIHELLDALKIPYFEVAGFEADDCIGTIAAQSKIDTVIVTGDRDMLQLINDHVQVYIPIKGLSETKTYDEAAVADEFGVTPKQWPDVKALKGDPSDNYPGVAGIGPKTAQSLISKYHTIENLYAHLSELDKRLAPKLAEGSESAGLGKKLAAIVTDVPLKFDLAAAAVAKIDWANGVKYMRDHLGFKTISARIEKTYLQKVDPQMKLI